MGTLRACAFVAITALVACGGDGGSTIDALIIVPDAAPDAPPDSPPGPTFDLSCLGNSPPTTIAASVVVSGTAQEVVISGMSADIVPAQDATVDFCLDQCEGEDLLDTQGPTGATGAFTSAMLSTGTPAAALDVHVRVTKTGNRTTLIYPAAPLVQDQPGVPAMTFSNTVIGLLGMIGVTQQPQNGNVILQVLDCSNQPITDSANIQITIKQGGMPVTGTDDFDVSLLDPSLGGTFAYFNVPPGLTELGATYNGMTLRAHDVRVVMGTSTATIVRPGF